jgi:hypothetical protein
MFSIYNEKYNSLNTIPNIFIVYISDGIRTFKDLAKKDIQKMLNDTLLKNNIEHLKKIIY